MTKRKSPSPDAVANAAIMPCCRLQARCCDPTGDCSRPCALKTTGEPHTRCEAHRHQANKSRRLGEEQVNRHGDAEQVPIRTEEPLLRRVPRSPSLSRVTQQITAAVTGANASEGGDCETRAIEETGASNHVHLGAHAQEDQQAEAETSAPVAVAHDESEGQGAGVAAPFTRLEDQEFQVFVSDVGFNVASNMLGSRARVEPASFATVHGTALLDDELGQSLRVLVGDVDWEDAKVLTEPFPALTDFMDGAHDFTDEDEGEDEDE